MEKNLDHIAAHIKNHSGSIMRRRLHTFAGYLLVLAFSVLAPGEALYGQAPGNAAQDTALTAEGLLAKCIAAYGGRERVNSIRTYRVETHNTLWLSRQKVQLAVTETVSLPDRTRQVMDLPGGERTQVLNGEEGWLKIGAEVGPLPNAEKREMQRGLFRETLNLLHKGARGEFTLKVHGKETYEGRTLHILNIKNADGDFVNLHIDADTFLPIKKSYRGSAEAGLATLEEIYSDYRDVDGLMWPFRIEVYANGRLFIESSVRDLELNPEIGPEVFCKP